MKKLRNFLKPPPPPKIEDVARWSLFDVIWLQKCTFDENEPYAVIMVGEGEYVRKTFPVCIKCFDLYKALNERYRLHGEPDEDESTVEGDK